jgi:manganese-dependent inorganic pyrophosphatase
MSQPEKVYVIGHRNPDTDSVCSAMAYAELCRLQGRDNVLPARAGHLNRQTEFVLESIGCRPPQLLADVYPRLRDTIDSAKVALIGADQPLVKALGLMRQRDIRMLPVVDVAARPLGALILKRLTEHVFLPRQDQSIRQVLTSPASVMACLQARAFNLVDADRVEKLSLFVGAMSLERLHDYLAGLDPRRIVLMVGDRADIQREAVELGVRLLVVTGGLPFDEGLLARARERGVSVLQTSSDTATSALLARLSTPVRHLIETDIPTAGPDDRTDEVGKVMVRSRAPGLMVLDDEGRVCGVVTKSNLLKPSPVKLVLVDHNELSQAVAGAAQVEILEVIDHHRLGNFHTDAPIRFINQPLGSTCSVVAELYRQVGLEPSRQVAALMLAGLMSDTVLLQSPTTTETDRQLVPWLEERSGLVALDFGHSLFQAGSTLAAYADITSLLTADFKEYEIEGRRVGIGQVEVVTFSEFDERREEILSGLAEFARQHGLALAALLVTDIVQQSSQLAVRGDADLVAAIDYPRIGRGLFELKGVLSRKKQLMPRLLKVLKQ